MPPLDGPNVPESLLDQCFTFIVRNLYIIGHFDPTTNCYELYPGLAFPRELCEKLVEFHYKYVGAIDDKFVSIFKDRSVTSLKRVYLRNSDISDKGLEILLNHNLIELDLEKCKNITEKSLSVLNEHGQNLLSLTIGNGVSLLPSTDENSTLVLADVVIADQSHAIRTPNLKKLVIINMMPWLSLKMQLDFNLLFLPTPQLIHLDLSGCVNLDHFSFLHLLNKLEFLILHNVVKVQEGLPFIYSLKSLRHLDISQSSDGVRTFHKANDTLADIVKNLPNLVSLDISGTNLAGKGVAETRYESGMMSDIPGLSARMNNKLEFLGLYGTQHAACRRHDIPAKRITGDANEEQILNAARAYIDRPEVLQKVLNDLYHLFRYDNCDKVFEALNVVLAAMDKHLSEKHIQISGSATLFYIVKNKDIPPLPFKTKRTVITILLNGMNSHNDDDTMMRNGCLTLCQFSIPLDVLFEYERLVVILLHIVSNADSERFVQRIGIYLLNSLACQVDNYQKQLLGDLSAVDKMLELINDRINRNLCDDVLEVAWSTMWNVTDETAINSERFLNGNGMDYFLQCLIMFPGKDELMRNMMGLLGNVAEVRHLRHRLMKSLYIDVFKKLVHSSSDGIEVSYNAAGVLSHLASDGPEAWGADCPPRHEVLRSMVDAIDHWNLETERNINYRSFQPILQLARVRHTPECQHWATWALANLTKVYPDKYCSLVEMEGGIEILQDIIGDDAPYSRIKELAQMVISHCRHFKEHGRVNVEPQLDG